MTRQPHVVTDGDPADPPLLLVGTTVHAWPDDLCAGLVGGGRFVVRYDLDCRPRWRERLGAIGVPMLVVHGADDPFFPVGNVHALAREIPGAQLLVLPGVGHELPRRAHRPIIDALLTLTAI